jgi:hypothetical protein
MRAQLRLSATDALARFFRFASINAVPSSACVSSVEHRATPLCAGTSLHQRTSPETHGELSAAFCRVPLSVVKDNKNRVIFG